MKVIPALGAIVLLAPGCGAMDASTVKASQEHAPPAAAVLRVVCEETGTRVLSSKVRARRDGAHFLFINRASMDEYWMRMVEGADSGNHGGYLRKLRQRDVASHPPGRMWVACFEKGEHPPYYEHDPRYAEFEIIDPQNLWIPYEVACDHPESFERRPIKGVNSVDQAERWIRENYDIPADATRVRPGYPETAWKGNPWVLVHEGNTIVHFSVYKERPDGVWRVNAEICT